MSDTYKTFTNAPPSPGIDLAQLQELSEECQKTFLAMFKGVPVRVDINLRDNEYYCMVSPEVYLALQRTP